MIVRRLSLRAPWETEEHGRDRRWSDGTYVAASELVGLNLLVCWVDWDKSLLPDIWHQNATATCLDPFPRSFSSGHLTQHESLASACFCIKLWQAGNSVWWQTVCRSVGGKKGKNRGVEGGGVLGRSFRYEFMSLAPGWNPERGIVVLTLGWEIFLLRYLTGIQHTLCVWTCCSN